MKKEVSSLGRLREGTCISKQVTGDIGYKFTY